jgi:hypothetical protein
VTYEPTQPHDVLPQTQGSPSQPPDEVASFDTVLKSPYTFQGVRISPSSIATFGDASAHAEAIHAFIAQALRDVDPNEPRHGTLSPLVDRWHRMAGEWASKEEPFVEVDRLASEVRTITVAMERLATEVGWCQTEVAWDFPALGVNMAMGSPLHNQGQMRAFATSLVRADPGGPAMRSFLTAALRARRANDVPEPKGAILDYFEEFRDRFDALGEAVPTEGVLDPDVDPRKFKAWLFDHRDEVWTCLYGSRRRS